MYVENDFDAKQWSIMMAITSLMPYEEMYDNGSIFINDKIALSRFPVLEGTKYAGTEGISKELMESIKWLPCNPEEFLLYTNLTKDIFKEHSLFLIKEHYKTVLGLSKNKEVIRVSKKILKKLNDLDG